MSGQDVITGFRAHYQKFDRLLADVLINPTDSFRLVRIGDDLEEFRLIVDEVSL
jgi:hypothetical protein